MGRHVGLAVRRCAGSMRDWEAQAAEQLLRHRAGAAGWGYQPGGAQCVEPTVLASLGLLAWAHGSQADRLRAAAKGAADWLSRIQQADGSLGISQSLPRPGWPTAWALLLWSNLDGYTVQREMAVAWLLERQGRAYTIELPNDPVGHDTTIVGWPWVAETHSWVEPTALAVLALRKQGLTAHQRTQDGLRLVRDRAILTGGWNCGNPALFGTTLRARPAPTGLALLALAGVDAWNSRVELACRYLQEVLPRIRSPQSLCWGLLGLAAWGKRLPEPDRWLAESYVQTARQGHTPPLLAYLLLARARRSFQLVVPGAVLEE